MARTRRTASLRIRLDISEVGRIERPREHEDVALGIEMLPRRVPRARGGDGADDRGVALDVVEPETVDLGAQELPRDPGVRLEAPREDAREIALRFLPLVVRRP